MSFSDFLGDLFAGSYTKLGGIKETSSYNSSVEQIFSGINYLQALSVSPRNELTTYLNGGKLEYAAGVGSLQSSTTDSIFNKFSSYKHEI